MTELIWFSIGFWSAVAAYLLGRLAGMHRHKWSAWVDVARVQLYDEDPSVATGHGIRQQRRCKACKELQWKLVRS